MAEKLGLGPEVRELKIGDSFSSNQIAFHTLRYDFKPASVAASKHASIEVGPNNQITVTHLESAGASQTVFKGSQRPYQKECVLIIDRNTGQITLEKLATNVQLKKTRQESHKSSNYGRPPTPVEKKPSPPGRGGHRTASTAGSGRSMGGAIPKHSPLPSSPSYPTRSPHRPLSYHRSPPQVHITASSPTPTGSLPILDDNENSSSSFDISASLNLPDIKTSPDFSGIQDDGAPVVGILSDSSSSSSSDSNSSDSDSEPEKPPPKKPINGHMNGKSSPALASVPTHLLNEDLQLSESGSDSD
ncbi:Promotes transcriptional elongation by Su(Tpl) ELL. Essential for development [Nesidiocoris tenuis]|uniref:Ell-associated factor Eaf n=1 Tax=Nesidiocoris tenuis TaxID=355587 RepID=A0ABN7AIS5_9HEMI|nr:Promotes transcriptional elongation by Su(Tpl) ELL. Essential for development [Nesidiocoris tenuis]